MANVLVMNRPGSLPPTTSRVVVDMHFCPDSNQFIHESSLTFVSDVIRFPPGVPEMLPPLVLDANPQPYINHTWLLAMHIQ